MKNNGLLSTRWRHECPVSLRPWERQATSMKILAFIMGVIIAASAVGQTAPDPIKLGDVDFTATLRSRAYVWNWFQGAAPYQNQYAYSGNLLRLNFSRKTEAM